MPGALADALAQAEQHRKIREHDGRRGSSAATQQPQQRGGQQQKQPGGLDEAEMLEEFVHARRARSRVVSSARASSITTAGSPVGGWRSYFKAAKRAKPSATLARAVSCKRARESRRAMNSSCVSNNAGSPATVAR